MARLRLILETSCQHLVLLDMAKRRAPTPSRLAMFDNIGRQINEYGSMTSAQIGLCQATITSTA